MKKRQRRSDCALWLMVGMLAPMTGCSLADAVADGVFSVVTGTVAQVLAGILGLTIGA